MKFDFFLAASLQYHCLYFFDRVRGADISEKIEEVSKLREINFMCTIPIRRGGIVIETFIVIIVLISKETSIIFSETGTFLFFIFSLLVIKKKWRKIFGRSVFFFNYLFIQSSVTFVFCKTEESIIQQRNYLYVKLIIW